MGYVVKMTEYPMLKVMYALSKHLNDTFVDVGAYHGYYTVRMAKVFKKVIAIDANPDNYKVLVDNVKLNGLSNVKMVNCGVSDKIEVLTLYDRGASSTFFVKKDAVKKHIVKTDTLDNILKDEPKIDLIKIDIEGYEVRAINGAKNIIEKHKPIFIIEHHQYRNYPEVSGEKDVICKMLTGYVNLNLNNIHWIHIPEDVDFDKIKNVLLIYWAEKMARNIKSNKPWYYGLPEKWWWGMNLSQCLYTLPEKINREEWFKSSED